MSEAPTPATLAALEQWARAEHCGDDDCESASCRGFTVIQALCAAWREQADAITGYEYVVPRGAQLLDDAIGREKAAVARAEVAETCLADRTREMALIYESAQQEKVHLQARAEQAERDKQTLAETAERYLNERDAARAEVAQEQAVRRVEREAFKTLDAHLADWQSAAKQVGEALAPVGPEDYYHFGPEEWRAWALAAIEERTRQWQAKWDQAVDQRGDAIIENGALQAEVARLTAEREENTCSHAGASTNGASGVGASCQTGTETPRATGASVVGADLCRRDPEATPDTLPPLPSGWVTVDGGASGYVVIKHHRLTTHVLADRYGVEMNARTSESCGITPADLIAVLRRAQAAHERMREGGAK